ncbi:MAG TPA: DUF885 family protein, partial [Sphingomicrobium sp.]|nr:DUF885 family protein [Sphingomicrobium sp.]
MRTLNGWLWLAGLALLVPAQLRAQASPARQTAANPADLKLRALYDGYAAWDAKESEQFEDPRGETKPTSHLPHVDAQSQLRRAAHLRELLDQLKAIPVQQFSPEERVNAAVFRTILENGVADARFRVWEMPFNSDSSFWTYLDARRSFADAAEYRRYISRMRDIPRYFDEQIANMRAGLARGFSVPRATLAGRDASIAAFIVDEPAKSSFLKAFEDMPSTIPQAEQQALKAEATKAIRTAVLPAYRKLLDFYKSEYFPKARATISARDLPDGDAYYRANIREYTTTDRTPEEIHEIGLKEVARIDA